MCCLAISIPSRLRAQDLYRTRGLIDQDFLYQYAATQQPGTSETSRISYDFLNNPNTINPIYNLGKRVLFEETALQGQKRSTMHILKDGAGLHRRPMGPDACPDQYRL